MLIIEFGTSLQAYIKQPFTELRPSSKQHLLYVTICALLTLQKRAAIPSFHAIVTKREVFSH